MRWRAPAAGVMSGEEEELSMRTNGPCKAKLREPLPPIGAPGRSLLGVASPLNNEASALLSGAPGHTVVRHVVAAASIGVRTELCDEGDLLEPFESHDEGAGQ